MLQGGLSQPYSLGGEGGWIIPRLCNYNKNLKNKNLKKLKLKKNKIKYHAYDNTKNFQKKIKF